MRRGDLPAGAPVRLVVSWQDRQDRRCAWCGRYLRFGAEAGHGWGVAFCELCHVTQEHRRAALWALGLAHGAVATGVA